MLEIWNRFLALLGKSPQASAPDPGRAGIAGRLDPKRVPLAIRAELGPARDLARWLEHQPKGNAGLRRRPELKLRHRRGLRYYRMGSLRSAVPVAFLAHSVRSTATWWTEKLVERGPYPLAEARQPSSEAGADERARDLRSAAESRIEDSGLPDGPFPDDPFPDDPFKVTLRQEVPITLLDGRPIVHVREEGVLGGVRLKRFRYLLADGTELSLDDLAKGLLPLYGIDLVHKQDAGVPAIVVEGMPAADALKRRGRLAVGTLTGALHTPADAALSPLVGRGVFLWPDNDDVGVRHMERIAQRLHRLGARNLRVIRWTGGPRKGDAHDFPDDEKALTALFDAAKPWKPGDPMRHRGVVAVNAPGSPDRLRPDPRHRSTMRAPHAPMARLDEVKALLARLQPVIAKVDGGETVTTEELLMAAADAKRLNALIGASGDGQAFERLVRAKPRVDANG